MAPQSTDGLVSTEYQPLEHAQPVLQMGERTGFQAVITSPWVMRWAAVPATYAVYREIRKHPTIALAREVACAPILAAEWRVEADKDAPSDAADLLDAVFMPIREDFLAPTLFFGRVDFGYAPFEKIFEARDGYLKLVRLKPLLHDITEICIGHQGNFVGYRQVGIELGLANALHIGFQVEGSYLYGIPLLENVRPRYYEWMACNEGAARYDRKIAGAHVVVEYVPGEDKDRNGVITDRAVLAQRIINTLESAGGVAIPKTKTPWDQSGSQDDSGWKVEISDSGSAQQGSFVERLNYLDKILCRGLLLPERAVLEGQHGTLAEAESHLDVAMAIAELEHRRIVRELNRQAVNQVLELNFGPRARGKARLVPSPIIDDKLAFLKEVYRAVLVNPQGFLEEMDRIDRDGLRDHLGIPAVPDEEATLTRAGAAPGMDTTDPMADEARRVYREANQDSPAAGGPRPA